MKTETMGSHRRMDTGFGHSFVASGPRVYVHLSEAHKVEYQTYTIAVYVQQGTRFEVEEGYGCSVAFVRSILRILTFEIWYIIPPLISAVFYFRTSFSKYRDLPFC